MRWWTSRSCYGPEMSDPTVLEEAGVQPNTGRVPALGQALDQLVSRCPGAVQVLASWAGGELVRLDWDDTCRARVVPAE